MNQKQKQTRWLLIMAFVLLVMAPLATFARTILYSIEHRVQSELRTVRRDVTRAQQHLFTLQSFAHSLSENSKLRKVVEPSLGNQAQWQSSIARTRLRLLDALSNPDSFMSVASSLTVERLERESLLNDTQEHSVEVERLWLSAKIQSVASGMSLLSQLDEVVSPYPLQAHGCSFRQNGHSGSASGSDDGDNMIDMRCLLSLTAWALPAVRHDSEFDDVIEQNAVSRRKPETEPDNVNRDKPTNEPNHGSKYGSRHGSRHGSKYGSNYGLQNKVVTAGTWKIFNRIEPDADNAPIKPKNILAKEVKFVEPRISPTGVITGPLGTMLIHGK